MKLCGKCKKWKDESEFYRNRCRKDGLRVWCKNCASNYARKYYLKNSNPLRRYLRYEESHRTIDGMKQKHCPKCKKWKDEKEFCMHRTCNRKDKLCVWCKYCTQAYRRGPYEKNRTSLKTYYRYEECHRVVGGMKQKLCRRCMSWKNESNFYKRRSNKDGLATWCKKCDNKARNECRKKRRMST